MFDTVTAPPPDGILKLMSAFADDPRPDKIDLGVGVYRDAAGATPIMEAVRTAGRRLWESETTKGYVGLAGDPAFLESIRILVLGDAAPADRVAAIATTGGTGAVRQALELVRRAAPGATVWVSDPTWPNHPVILDAVGLRWRRYRYRDAATGALDRDGMRADLQHVAPGDVVLLHGCCHNPTGIDLSADDWTALGRLCAERGVLPLVDVAYQGFGDGVEADVAGLRSLARAVPEALVCVSGSKTFGLYRERVGALMALCDNRGARSLVQARLAGLNREACSFPPDHGARLVTMVLTDDALRAAWQAELDGMRARIGAMRTGLAAALRAETGSDRFGFLADQRGMFSLLGVDRDAIVHLREAHAVYAVEDGRINLAGLREDTIPLVARALADTLS